MREKRKYSKDIVLDIKIWSNPNRLGGWWCFNGTRLPIQCLDDYLEGSVGFGGDARMNFRKLFRDHPLLKDIIKINKIKKCKRCMVGTLGRCIICGKK